MASIYTSFLEHRGQLLSQASDPALKSHYQAEIDLVRSWEAGGIADPEPPPPPPPPPPPAFDSGSQAKQPAPALPPVTEKAQQGIVDNPPSQLLTPPIVRKQPVQPADRAQFNTVPNGYAPDWHTIRFSNTTAEPLTVQFTMGFEKERLLEYPPGLDANHRITIEPGSYVDLSFEPRSHFNFHSTRGDGTVYNLGEFTFRDEEHAIYGDVSYIHGANSNLRIFSEDGRHSGYLGDIIAGAPDAARVGDWGIMAPYSRTIKSDDPNNPDSAAGGPGAPQNAGGQYFYSVLKEGEGYVNRGRPVQNNSYDDQSTQGFRGRVSVVF